MEAAGAGGHIITFWGVQAGQWQNCSAHKSVDGPRAVHLTLNPSEKVPNMSVGRTVRQIAKQVVPS
eukprot:357548-Chlamydomonas_euryale.AAC.4